MRAQRRYGLLRGCRDVIPVSHLRPPAPRSPSSSRLLAPVARVVTVLPFYGTRRPDLFAIERAAMDRAGLVVDALDRLLPRDGRVLDIGAGDGFTASALSNGSRSIVSLEPSAGMVSRARSLPWVRGDAEALPLSTGSFTAAYATWAYFFPSVHPIEAGVLEAERVVARGGVLALVNNLGDDEFCGLSSQEVHEQREPFEALGFSVEVVETSFEFESLEQARELLGFYFGDSGREGARLRLGYRVGLFHKRVT